MTLEEARDVLKDKYSHDERTFAAAMCVLERAGEL
jgi:hypothetical protein